MFSVPKVAARTSLSADALHNVLIPPRPRPILRAVTEVRFGSQSSRAPSPGSRPLRADTGHPHNPILRQASTKDRKRGDKYIARAWGRSLSDAIRTQER